MDATKVVRITKISDRGMHLLDLGGKELRGERSGSAEEAIVASRDRIIYI